MSMPEVFTLSPVWPNMSRQICLAKYVSLNVPRQIKKARPLGHAFLLIFTLSIAFLTGYSPTFGRFIFGIISSGWGDLGSFGVVAQFDCHPEQAFLARREIWASRAMPDFNDGG
jgi:hypothetical protein